jgi:hypothetical protein
MFNDQHFGPFVPAAGLGQLQAMIKGQAKIEQVPIDTR